MLNHPELAYQRVLRLYESSDSALWIGTETNGLFRSKNGEVIHFHKQNGFPGNAVNSISELSDGTIVALIHNRGLVFIKDKKIEVETTTAELENVEAALRIYRGMLSDLQVKIDEAEKAYSLLEDRFHKAVKSNKTHEATIKGLKTENKILREELNKFKK